MVFVRQSHFTSKNSHSAIMRFYGRKSRVASDWPLQELLRDGLGWTQCDGIPTTRLDRFKIRGLSHYITRLVSLEEEATNRNIVWLGLSMAFSCYDRCECSQLGGSQDC